MRNEVSKIESSTTEAVNIYSNSVLETFKALVDEAFRDAPLNLRQDKAAAILSEAHKHLARNDFRELESYVFERLEK